MAAVNASQFSDENATKRTFTWLNKLRKSGTLCDVTLSIADKSIRVHSNVLSSASSYFSSVLGIRDFSEISERLGGEGHNGVDLPSINESSEYQSVINPQIIHINVDTFSEEDKRVYYDSMLLIVDYIYTGVINISEIYVDELFQLSQLLQLDRLVGFCEKFIFEQNNTRLDSSTTDLTTDKALPMFIYKGFENEKEKTKEKTTETIYRSNKCKSCDFVGKTQRLLREHRHRFHLRKQVGATICPMCSMEFDDVDQCVEHKRMHTAKVTTNSLRFPCAVCDKEYQWKWELRKHAIKHVVTKNYLCPICSRRYKREITLLKHMELHKRPTLYTKSESNDDLKPVKRRTIGPVDDSQNLNLLNIDMDQLFGVTKNHSCLTCGLKFHSKAKLRQHMMNHPQSMLFNCYICSFNTVEKSDIEDHLLKEHKIGEFSKDIPVFVKPMSCSTKVIKAETSSTCVSHTDRTVMGKKPTRRTGEFRCSLCDKVFKLKHILKRHILDMHSADRPFKCRVCKFDTKRRGNLKDHMWYVHKLVLSPEPKKVAKSDVKNVMDAMYPIVLANDEMSVDDVVEVG